jgi:hypothetical protein
MRTVLTSLCVLVLAAVSWAQSDPDAGWLPLTAIERAALEDDSGKLHGLPTPFTPYNTSRPKIPRRVQVLTDRDVYMANDEAGQAIIYFIGEDFSASNAALKVELVRVEGDKTQTVWSQTYSPVRTAKRAVQFPVQGKEVKPGEYRLRATLQNVPHARAIPEAKFTISGERRNAFPIKDGGVDMLTHALDRPQTTRYPIRTFLPMGRGSFYKHNDLDMQENGKPVPAQWTTRAAWNPSGIHQKWLGLDFIAEYENGKPRAYRVASVKNGQTPATALKLTEQPDRYVIDTGALRFTVNRRRFAGVEDVRLVRADGSVSDALLADGAAGGPFLRDERLIDFTAANDQTTSVTVEEAGPVRLTLYATGWYTSERNERVCLYQTRISAFAGLPWIDIEHRTVITFDTDRKKLRELGFAFRPVGGERWSFGIDGQPQQGVLPAAEPKKPLQSVFLHQDRWNHLRLVQGEQQVSEGSKSDGWASVRTPAGTVGVAVRNLWQTFPKEMEINREGLFVHVWPRHGRVAFSEEESLAVEHIHKLRCFHQGAYLDLKLPQSVFDALVAHGRSDAGLGKILEQQDINAISGNGQGLAVSNEFSLWFSAAEVAAADAALVQHAELYQQNPHALPDPIYTGKTEVEGPFAGRDPQRFPEMERLLDDGYRGYVLPPDVLETYGMWIWPDVHNNWEPVRKRVQLHRWWNNSHYQNVWEGNFLYLRSGLPWIGRWAANNTRHFMDVSTVNYHNPAEPLLGKLTGANFHAKGFTPWGSPRQHERVGDDYVEVGAHFVNPDAMIIRWLMHGDHHAMELAKAWFDAFGHVALPPERSREANATLGEMISYYETTWDPQAIVYIRDLADDLLSRPWKEIPAHPGHTLFHDRWVQRYWWLTGDERIKQRVLEWFEPGEEGKPRFYYPQVRALAWRWTGDQRYLTQVMPQLAGLTQGYYDNPGDPMHGFGGRDFFWPTHSIGQMGPYYLQALIDAKLTLPAFDEQSVPAIAKAVTLEKDKPGAWFVAPDKTPDTRLVGYLKAAGPEPVVDLKIEGAAVERYGFINTRPCYVRLTDAQGKVLLETSLQAASQRPSATIRLDARTSRQPWRLYRVGSGTFQWTGSAQSLTLTPQPQDN